MFKYIRTLNACSGIVETFNLPAPISEDMQCDVGTICCIDDGRLSSAKSDNGAKYLVLFYVQGYRFDRYEMLMSFLASGVEQAGPIVHTIFVFLIFQITFRIYIF